LLDPNLVNPGSTYVGAYGPKGNNVTTRKINQKYIIISKYMKLIWWP